MYVQVNIHRPRPGKTEDVVASMQRYGVAVRTQPGLIAAYTIESSDGSLLGVAVWTSKAACDAGRVAGRNAVMGDPFDEWEAGPIVGFEGETR